jgi:hypothetical protein
MRGDVDGFSKDGADALALTITNYWRERGHDNVRAWPYLLPVVGMTWGIRSNLVAGLPRKQPV